MKCLACGKEGGKRRYNKYGDRLYTQPMCDFCTSEFILVGYDIVLEPNQLTNHISQNPKWPNYPILKGIELG